jgi:hypothetical protein
MNKFEFQQAVYVASFKTSPQACLSAMAARSAGAWYDENAPAEPPAPFRWISFAEREPTEGDGQVNRNGYLIIATLENGMFCYRAVLSAIDEFRGRSDIYWCSLPKRPE